MLCEHSPLWDSCIYSEMANHYGNHRSLVGKNVPIILTSGWQDGTESLGMETTSCLAWSKTVVGFLIITTWWGGYQYLENSLNTLIGHKWVKDGLYYKKFIVKKVKPRPGLRPDINHKWTPEVKRPGFDPRYNKMHPRSKLRSVKNNSSNNY